MMIVGIDPGLSGALAFFDTSTNKIHTYDTPVMDKAVNAAEVANLLNNYGPDAAIIEVVHAMPSQGVSSMFRFGQAYGTVLGALAACRIPTHYVASTRWKKHFHLTTDKEKSRAVAISLWPDCREFNRKKDHGRAEAALLSLYALETIYNK